MTLSFAVTDYKTQGTIFQIAIFDLHKNFNSMSKILHKRFYFIYI